MRIGVALVVGAVLVLAGFWFVPFGLDDPIFLKSSCVPIVEASRSYPEGFPIGADPCHLESIQRVQIGAMAGGALGILGAAVFIGSWQGARRPQDGSRAAGSGLSNHS